MATASRFERLDDHAISTTTDCETGVAAVGGADTALDPTDSIAGENSCGLMVTLGFAELPLRRSQIFTGSIAESEKVAMILEWKGSCLIPLILRGRVAKCAGIDITSAVAGSIRMSYIRTYERDVPTARHWLSLIQQIDEIGSSDAGLNTIAVALSPDVDDRSVCSTSQRTAHSSFALSGI